MKVQMWWCERCGALGAVLHEDHADVMSVVYALGGQHAKTTPQCPIDATHLRVIVPENIKEPFTFTVKIEADRRSQALELQVDELRRALYAECRSLACGPECVGGGYRKCTGCDSRAKMAYGMPWEEVAEKPQHEAPKCCCHLIPERGGFCQVHPDSTTPVTEKRVQAGPKCVRCGVESVSGVGMTCTACYG